MKALYGVLVALLLTGCANGYKQFYQAAPGATQEAINARRAGPPPANPQIGYVNPQGLDAAIDSAYQRGYVLIGSASFTSGEPATEQQAIEQGREVGADAIMVVSPTHVQTINSMIPMTVPTSTTTYSTGSATAYGTGGPVTAYGNGISTTYGSKTTYIPYTINRNQYAAYYFVKTRSILGVFARDLNDDEKRAAQTNKGAAVVAVVNGSPAFEADILPGDLLLSIGGETIINQDQYSDVLQNKAGALVEIRLLRGGSVITKQVQLQD